MPNILQNLEKPSLRPNRPEFSSGPCAKRPGWSLSVLNTAFIGRSHRAKQGKEKLSAVIDTSKALLGIPKDWKLGIVPASDTGAVEMALWSLLGARGVDVLAWDAFGKTWLGDIEKELKISDIHSIEAPYGELPNLGSVTGERDIVFTWNGTTSGVCVPDATWIPEDRSGLAICDATSAVFAMPVDFSRLDVVTWSWQKVLGGEAAHGMLALSPRAVERLESYTPERAIPKIFRLTKGGKLIDGIFRGETINTPSMLAVEDALDGLDWAQSIGGLPALMQRSQENFAAVADWIRDSTWADFLASEPKARSTTSICLKIKDPWFGALDEGGQKTFIKSMTQLLEKEKVAYDIASYRDAPAGLRIWGGSTIEHGDIKALLPWLDWSYASQKAESENQR